MELSGKAGPHNSEHFRWPNGIIRPTIPYYKDTTYLNTEQQSNCDEPSLNTSEMGDCGNPGVNESEEMVNDDDSNNTAASNVEQSSPVNDHLPQNSPLQDTCTAKPLERINGVKSEDKRVKDEEMDTNDQSKESSLSPPPAADTAADCREMGMEMEVEKTVDEGHRVLENGDKDLVEERVGGEVVTSDREDVSSSTSKDGNEEEEELAFQPGFGKSLLYL